MSIERTILGACAFALLAAVALSGLVFVGFATVLAGLRGAAPAYALTPGVQAPALSVSETASRPSPPVLSNRGLAPGWAERGPIDQYARSSYGSDQTWLT